MDSSSSSSLLSFCTEGVRQNLMKICGMQNFCYFKAEVELVMRRGMFESILIIRRAY